MTLDISYEIKDNKKGADVGAFLKDYNGKTTLKDFVDTLVTSHIRIAKDVLKEEQDRGFDKNPRKRVDNKFDVPEERLKPFGKIEYFARTDVEYAILGIWRLILDRSPIRTGTYIQGHVLVYNNQIAGTTVSQIKQFFENKRNQGGFKEGDRFIFVNTRPYARRLEYAGTRRSTTGANAGQTITKTRKPGKSKKTGNLIKRPSGAYYLSYVIGRRRFKSIANRMTFKFLPGDNIYFAVKSEGGRWRTTFAGNFKGTKKGRVGKPYLYPSIIITLSGLGITDGGVNNVQ